MMKSYKRQMEQIRYTAEGKASLIVSVTEKKRPGKPLGKALLVAATVGILTVIVCATGAFGLVSTAFGPIFGEKPQQILAMEDMGTPLDVHDTQNGITVSAVAMIGDEKNVAIIYEVTQEDGSPLELPEGMDPHYLCFDGSNVGMDFHDIHSSGHGSRYSEVSPDGILQIVDTMSWDENLPLGKTGTVTFQDLGYWGPDNAQQLLWEGQWTLEFPLNYEDSTQTIAVNQDFSYDDMIFTVGDIHLSPLGIHVDYQVDVSNLAPKDADTEALQNFYEQPWNHLADDLPLLVTKTDGTVLDLTQSGGGYDNRDGKLTARKHTLFDQILPLDEVESITVGDVVVQKSNF